MKLDTQQKTQLDQEQQRKVLGKAFFNLTKHWVLTREEEAGLLGWTYKQKRTKVDSLREGNTVLSQDRDKIERILDLLNIHKSLRVLFPYDREAVYQWVKIPRERFGGYSALEVMLEDGKEGISAIRRYLDYERTR
jgi:antitoxin Xre/MbcA/ParS-like protein